MSGVLKGALSFIGIGKSNVKQGIESVMGAGNALVDIAKGLTYFDQVTGKMNLGVKRDSKGNVQFK